MILYQIFGTQDAYYFDNELGEPMIPTVSKELYKYMEKVADIIECPIEYLEDAAIGSSVIIKDWDDDAECYVSSYVPFSELSPTEQKSIKYSINFRALDVLDHYKANQPEVYAEITANPEFAKLDL